MVGYAVVYVLKNVRRVLIFYLDFNIIYQDGRYAIINTMIGGSKAYL
jgi:hypothetical protein